MKPHQWFSVDGKTFCATCGFPEASAPKECREPEKPQPKPLEAPIEELRELQAPTKSDEEMAVYLWENETVPRLKAANFDSRFWVRHQENIIPGMEKDFEEWKKVLNFCQDRCQGKGAIIVLAGVRGTGKTTICSQMAIARAESTELPPWDRQPPYRKLQALFERYKPLYADFGSTKTDELSSSLDWYCRTPSLAFIDEIHECSEARVAERMLTDILDRRYSARRDTILITNQSPEEFRDTANGSIKSRISEHGAIIPCFWASWRNAK
jgi:DNA replication protein DnaC